MGREIVKYNTNLKERARELRNNATPMEKRLWKYLKGKQIEGYDFHRQKPINSFILDFYCSELKLAIEVDGSSHMGKEEYDKERQNIIENYGVTFLRFTNSEVKNNLEDVLDNIRNWIKENAPKTEPKNVEKTNAYKQTKYITENNRNLTSPLESEAKTNAHKQTKYITENNRYLTSPLERGKRGV